jgi:CBS domain-containing protein
MNVRDGMSTDLLAVGVDHTLRDVARKMIERGVGAAVVLDPDAEGPGIITERDILRSLAVGEDPDHEHVRDHLTPEAIVGQGSWDIGLAAETMVRGGFRHLIVVGADGTPEGMLSIRDVVRGWLAQRAATERAAT